MVCTYCWDFAYHCQQPLSQHAPPTHRCVNLTGRGADWQECPDWDCTDRNLTIGGIHVLPARSTWRIASTTSGNQRIGNGHRLNGCFLMGKCMGKNEGGSNVFDYRRVIATILMDSLAFFSAVWPTYRATVAFQNLVASGCRSLAFGNTKYLQSLMYSS